MERFAGVPRSVVDTITAVFIIFATMETLFQFSKGKFAARKKKKQESSKSEGGKSV